MGKGKEKRKQAAIPADRDSKRPRVDDGASSSTSAPLENGGGLHPEDVTSDQHSVLKEPPPPQVSTQFIEAQGEPPTGGSKWNFNLEESPGGTPGGALELPAVPPGWQILEALPGALPGALLEELATIPEEALLNAMLRCCSEHRMVG